MSINRCVCCGAEIPEGRQVCPICEAKSVDAPVPYNAGENRPLKSRRARKIDTYTEWRKLLWDMHG